ncbi:DUF1033 family protein [Sporosarcina gallistercoris]|uniref:DUF1033 family protein n=1 Tax=Sporosarcina gallistercoris TaxID=2762245 RepID=UPI003D294CB6
MYEVIYMKADYEPWWMFEGWEEMVRLRRSFEELEDAVEFANSIMDEMRRCFSHEKTRKGSYAAFWNPGERTYCDGCDDDLQLYHGVFMLKDCEPVTFIDEK